MFGASVQVVPLEELVLAPLEVVVADVELLGDAESEGIPHDDVTEAVGLAIDAIGFSIGLQSSNQDQGEHTVLVQCERHWPGVRTMRGLQGNLVFFLGRPHPEAKRLQVVHATNPCRRLASVSYV